MDEWIASVRCVERTQEFELARSSVQPTVLLTIQQESSTSGSRPTDGSRKVGLMLNQIYAAA